MQDDSSNRTTPSTAEISALTAAVRDLASRMERMERSIDALKTDTATSNPAPVPRAVPISTGPQRAPGGAPAGAEQTPTVDTDDSPAPMMRASPTQPPARDASPGLGSAAAPRGPAAPGKAQEAPPIFRRSDRAEGPSIGGAASTPREPEATPDRVDQLPPSLNQEGGRQSRIAKRFAERADETDTRGINPQIAPPATPPGRRRRKRGSGLLLIAVIGLASILGALAYFWHEARKEQQEVASAVNGPAMQEILDQEPDEVLPVDGQSPLPENEEDEVLIAEAEEAAAEADEATASEEPAEIAAAPENSTPTEEEESPLSVPVPRNEDGTLAEAPAPEPVEEAPPPPQEGPAVAAAPQNDVTEVPLERNLAPLPEDADPVLQELAASALQGDPNAMNDLANIYVRGATGVPRDEALAAYWFQRASDGGIVLATYNLGVMISQGMGVPVDQDRAFALFRQSAEAGHPDGQLALGLSYLNGTGTEQDPQQAVRWFQAASSNGRPEGALVLGQLYERGIDGAPDLAAAAGWYRIAAEAGNQAAAEQLARLTAAEQSQQAVANDVPVPDSTPEPSATGGTGATPQPTNDPELDRDGVREVQRLLNQRGYDAGTVDGLFGPTTANAIRAFQQSQGLPVNGEPTQSLLRALGG